MPFNKILEWIELEKALGVKDSDCAVLSTVANGVPHARTVAVREIKEDGLIFFTSSQTRKAVELLHNPAASMTFVFFIQGRQITLEGSAKPLSQKENHLYWATLPRERQICFSAYAPFSGQTINSLDSLEKRKDDIEQCFSDQAIPMSEFYTGFQFLPETFIFYTSGAATFSEVIRYTKGNGGWKEQLISP